MTVDEPPTRLIHDARNTAVWPIRPEHFITPANAFFTRSHGTIPRIDAATWRLEVGGLVDRPASFSLEELLRRFPRREVTATLVCAGLRRAELLSAGPLPGELPWGPEPASTGRWAGIALGDVLRAVGVSERAGYVELTGLDEVERGGARFGFGGSIDLAKALGPEVLLAHELDGDALPTVHGFPLRALVPGWIGARSVKWLGRITLSAAPSTNYFQSQAYRLQREGDPRNPRDVSAGVALTEAPLNAVIVEPAAGQVVAAGQLRVRGWAMGSGGRQLRQVELSPDDGQRWMAAHLTTHGPDWTWGFWEAVLELKPGERTLVVRATDTTGRMQPATVAETWNVKGYNNNAWHRVTLQVE
ncbi:MAG TPA: sulfite oxidase [Gemmatimonadales bacterium]|jgi:sulfite oxidase|nr:sulfite oxidase [Gemmatimonadales bacterium]